MKKLGSARRISIGRWTGHQCDTIFLAVYIQRTITIFLAILSAYLLFPQVVNAHPGRTDANGGHTCRTNCASWGLGDGEYHSHGGGGSSSGGSSGGSYIAPIQETVQTQEVVTPPTSTPVPTRLPTRISTRIPTKPPTPAATLISTPTPTITVEPSKQVRPVRADTTSQKPQGFFDWLLSLFGLR
jgi:hypothetical protein